MALAQLFLWIVLVFALNPVVTMAYVHKQRSAAPTAVGRDSAPQLLPQVIHVVWYMGIHWTDDRKYVSSSCSQKLDFTPNLCSM